MENFSSREDSCPKRLIPKLCAFDKGDVQKYEATYYLSYVGVGKDSRSKSLSTPFRIHFPPFHSRFLHISFNSISGCFTL